MYVILSERVGTLGAKFDPADGVKIDALLAGGVIGLSSTTKAPKYAKSDTDTDTDTETDTKD